jgi:fluoride ion exporter CrcB/FEX
VDVRDSGPGIPVEHRSKVFERFYRVDKSRSRGEGGAGLGLSICEWVVHAHGGRIERFLLVVGFLGGYTTFSSFEWETLGLVRDGGRWLGLINAVGSVVLGYIAVWLGAAVAAKR